MQESTQKLRVLVGYKSSYARLVLESIISTESDIKLVGMTADGDELLKQLKETKADVILIDYCLPKNNRLFTIKRIFSEVPTPVVLLVDKEHLTLELMQEATALGVYAVVIKPKGAKFKNYRVVGQEVLQKIRAVHESEYGDAQARLHMLQQEVDHIQVKTETRKPEDVSAVVVIGASTGGTQAIETIVRQLSPDLKAGILVAVHLPSRFTRSFAKRLHELTSLTVVEGRNGLQLKPGNIIIAPGGRNMVVQSESDGIKIGFTDEEATLYDQPSVDLLMKSVANSNIKNSIGIILTGMGKDGTEGAAYLKQNGGVLIAQDQESSAIFGMAKSAIGKGLIDEVLPLEQIPHYINSNAAQYRRVSVIGSIT